MNAASIQNVSLLEESHLNQLIAMFKAIYTPPISPMEQLMCIISEAYRNWIETAEKRKLLMSISKGILIPY